MKDSKIVNHYNPDKHIGKQPVRVLFDGLIHYYSNWTELFKEEFNREIHTNGLNRMIMIDIYEGPIDKVAFVDASKTIRIEESFLSFIWTICYAQLVIAEKTNPRTKDVVINPADMELGQSAFNVFSYGMSLVKKFTRWPESFPNPEKYPSSNAHYIERANRFFLYVCTFILYHEFSHVYLGHIDLDNDGHLAGSDEYIRDELSADKNAIEIIMETDDLKNNNDGKASILLGLSALLLLSSSLDGGTHPDPDQRLDRAIQLLGIDSESKLYNIPCMSYYLWSFHFKKNLKMPQNYASPKERFEKINSQIKALKSI